MRGSRCRSWPRAPSSPTRPRSSTTSTSTRSTPRSARTTCRARPSRRASPRSCARSTRRTRTTRSCPPPSGSRGDPGAAKRPPAGVHVEGLDDLMVRLSRCCTPVPGDEILGFVTRGRGVSVHRADCANAVSLAAGQKDRLIDVEWDESHDGTFVAAIEVKALDRGRLLRDVAASHERPPREHPQLRHRTPAPTASRRCASSSSWPTPATSTPSSPPSEHRQRLRGLPRRPRPGRVAQHGVRPRTHVWVPQC